jgi:hypothetical protein
MEGKMFRGATNRYAEHLSISNADRAQEWGRLTSLEGANEQT